MAACPEILWMPLHRQQIPIAVLVLKGLDGAVRGGPNDLETLAEFLDRLVMDRIDPVDARTEDGCDPRTLLEHDLGMWLVCRGAYDVMAVGAAV